jgi:hypothetical protein
MNNIFRYVFSLVMIGAGVSGVSSAQQAAQKDPGAMGALDKMGAYLRSVRAFQVQADVTQEEVLDNGEKIQFAHRTNLLAQAPDRVMIDIEGDRQSRLYLFDRGTFTAYARRAGYYATMTTKTTIVELADVLDDQYDMELPLIDLFLWGGPRSSVKEITSAADIGPSQVGGVSCEHYAFRQPGLDWQVWIQKGDFPLPRKLVLTTTTDEARPQHTSVLTWNLAPAYNDAAFQFVPPPGVNKIKFADAETVAKARKT